MINRTIRLISVATTLFVTVFLLHGCSLWMFDFAGKGAKAKCLSMATKPMLVKYDCNSEKIGYVSISGATTKKGTYRLLFKELPDTAVTEYVLPLNRDTLNSQFLEIEFHITKDHYRMTYYIFTEPGDFDKDQTIYSRFYSH